MPIYRLDGTADVNLSGHSAVQVSWVTRGSTDPVRIEALVDGRPTDRVMRPRPDLLVVPPAPFPVTLRVVPVGTSFFATPTEIEVQFAIGDQRLPDPQIVRLSPKNLSGLSTRNLVMVEQVGTSTRLRALETVRDPVLPELADQARAIARTVLSVDRLPAARTADVSVVVDTSGSMLPLLRDGTVAAALEVLAGVAQVISADGQLTVYGVGSEAVELAPAAGGDVAEAVVAQLEGSVLSSGFRSAAIPTPAHPSAAVTFVLTDAVPADLGRRAAGQRLHLVPLLSMQAWSILGAGVPIPASVLEPGTDQELARDRLRRRQDELRQFVTSLTSQFTHDGGLR